jgi:predicted choloylglycine hydrolase
MKKDWLIPTCRLYLLSLILVLTSCGVSKSINHTPDISIYNDSIAVLNTINDTTFTSGNNSFHKNAYGLWELYIEGNPYQLGLNAGLLTQELFKFQEHAFLSKVDELVPSKFKQSLLRKLLAFYNRKLYLYVPPDYKAEIYGLSKYASNDYKHIADNYLRILYLHGAHDIGHAFQDLALVGCSSFAVWGNKSEDGKLLIGRNFDFYAGDDFAKNKIIAFVNPTEGYKFMSVTWAGMIGVVSGMNEQGLTVTINAGKSEIPLIAKTPISLLTREILQFASNIDEAIAIAQKRQVFVSESIFVGSANDKKAITIEVSPTKFGVYEVENTTQLICTNHFQSSAYADDKNNIKHIAESHSQYRYKKLETLLNAAQKLTVKDAVAILRNKEGLENNSIGYGNEKALNQLLAHHGIVFKPESRQVWVSSNPYQLGEFVAYDLNEVFKDSSSKLHLSQPKFNVEADPFLYTEAYKDYESYRTLITVFKEDINNGKNIAPSIIQTFQNLNPDYWEVYFLIGLYYYNKGYYTAALNNFEIAKTKEVTTVPDQRHIEHYIKKLKRKLSQ